MRDTMRQLLSRKSNPRMSDGEPLGSQHRAFSPPRNPTAERVFPFHNPGGNADILGFSLSVKNGGLRHNQRHDDERSEYTNHSSSRSDGRRSPGLRSTSRARDRDEQRVISERSQYLPPTASGPPRVLTGAVADKAGPTYRRCEDEPIHTPGSIQSFGALLGLKYSDEGYLEVRVASENSRKILGYGPEQLFALSSFLDVLKRDMREELVSRINHALSDVHSMKEETRLDVFEMTLTFPFEPETRLWCAVHVAGPGGLIICEFEEYSEAFHMKDIRAAKILPVDPVRLGYEVSQADFEKSTNSSSKPLLGLEITRQKQNKQFSSLDLFNTMTQAQKQISSCESVQDVLEVSVGIISELTGFHRVMFYRFDSQKNGCVDAELLNPQASSDVFRGLHYPASDIPKQARDLYKINRIRILHDSDADTARLVCRDEKDFKSPLDLSHAYLRAMSPVHLKYLTNMGVRSTVTISTVIDSDLWGLIACHGYGDVGIRVSPPIRELCRNIGECAAVNIQRLLMMQRVEARRPPITNPASGKPGLMTSSPADLLKLVDADFALLSVDDKARAIGKLDPYREALAIMAYLQACRFTTIRCSHNIKADFPGFSYPPGLTISGLLLIPLNSGEGNDFLVFFRKGQLRNLKWAGNPYDSKYKSGTDYLEPRASFQRWDETIVGTSKEWTEDQLDTASILALMYSRFIEVWRQKGSASQNNQMSREVRTPLNAIVNYLEMALDSHKVDDKTRDILSKAQKASRSLIYVMDDLLKLSEIEDGPVSLVDETFNLKLTALKALQELQKEAHRKGLDLNVSVHENLPVMVKGNGKRFKQVIIYFTSNAFKKATRVKVDINLLHTKGKTSIIELQVQDAGPGMSETELDETFQDFEQAQNDDNWPFPAKDSTPSRNDTNGEADIQVVARYVRNVNGQIQVTSELGKGTLFTVELPFENLLPDAPKPRKLGNLFSRSALSGPKSPRPLASDLPRKVEMSAHIDSALSPRGMIPPFDRGLSPRPSTYDLPLNLYSKNEEIAPLYAEHGNHSQQSLVNLNVLIAEDDPRSLRMLDERLSQWGHNVDIVYDGQECYDRFASNPSKVDVIIMELKLPSVDGALSTRMIRFLEKESSRRLKVDTQDPQKSVPRVPIIAVSTALYEENRFEYIKNGFDGWIPKPIDVRRLDLILQGVKIASLRRDTLYTPGQWEKGGWFLP